MRNNKTFRVLYEAKYYTLYYLKQDGFIRNSSKIKQQYRIEAKLYFPANVTETRFQIIQFSSVYTLSPPSSDCELSWLTQRKIWKLCNWPFSKLDCERFQLIKPTFYVLHPWINQLKGVSFRLCDNTTQDSLNNCIFPDARKLAYNVCSNLK